MQQTFKHQKAACLSLTIEASHNRWVHGNQGLVNGRLHTVSDVEVELRVAISVGVALPIGDCHTVALNRALDVAAASAAVEWDPDVH